MAQVPSRWSATAWWRDGSRGERGGNWVWESVHWCAEPCRTMAGYGCGTAGRHERGTERLGSLVRPVIVHYRLDVVGWIRLFPLYFQRTQKVKTRPNGRC